jgi:pimeloyl-ACP methyl ester carboxylesterase
MSLIHIHGADIDYIDLGAGPETIVFIHGLMLARESYDRQIEAFQSDYRIIAYDLRGQGRSQKTTDRLDLESLTEDAAALVETLNGAPVHIVGFSMGTFIAMRLAARYPHLVRSLTLIGPSAEAEDPENMPRYEMLIRLVRLFGARPFVSPMMKILFGDTYLADRGRREERKRWRRILARLPRALHRAAAASAHRKPIADELPGILAPTLVVSGAEDRPIAPSKSRAVAGAIAGAEFISFPSTGHAAMIERPKEFNEKLRTFLSGVRSSTS